MSKLTEDQIAMRELRDAAYHEAGHKVMCRRYGGDGDIFVWRNRNGNPDERAWGGQFRTRICPQVMHDAAKRGGFPAVDLPDNWRALFGVAGMVAEGILHHEDDHDAELIAGSIFVKIICGEASATDLMAMGITNIDDFEFSEEEVEQAWGYLKEEWPLIQKEAESIIAEALTA